MRTGYDMLSSLFLNYVFTRNKMSKIFPFFAAGF